VRNNLARPRIDIYAALAQHPESMVPFEDGSIGSRLQGARLSWTKRLEEPIRGHFAKLAKLYLAQNSC
jgi:hypothetical protein